MPRLHAALCFILLAALLSVQSPSDAASAPRRSAPTRAAALLSPNPTEFFRLQQLTKGTICFRKRCPFEHGVCCAAKGRRKRGCCPHGHICNYDNEDFTSCTSSSLRKHSSGSSGSSDEKQNGGALGQQEVLVITPTFYINGPAGPQVTAKSVITEPQPRPVPQISQLPEWSFLELGVRRGSPVEPFPEHVNQDLTSKRNAIPKHKPILPVPNFKPERLELPIEKMPPVFPPIVIPGSLEDRAVPSQFAAGHTKPSAAR